MKFLLTLGLLLAPVCRAQVLRADVGASNYVGSGVGFTFYRPNNDIFAGAGYFNNHFVFGLADNFVFHGYDTTLGSSYAGLNVDGGSITVPITGVQLIKRSEDSSLQVFSGASGVGASILGITTVRPNNYATGGLYRRKERGVWLSGLGVLDSGKISALGSGLYQTSSVYWSATGGLLSAQKFFNSGVGYKKNWFTVHANHQEWFNPYRVTGDSANISVIQNWFLASASVNESHGIANVTGESAGIGFRIGQRFSESSTYYKSVGEPYVFHQATERFGRFTFQQGVIQQAGHNGYSFGGGFQSNRMTVSLSHQIQFLLNGAGFVQVTSIGFQFRIHDTLLHATTITSPYGKVEWSTDTDTYQQVGSQQVGGFTASAKFEKYKIEGVCQQADGSVVEGCVLEIGGRDEVISGADGKFEYQVNNAKAVNVVPKPEEFFLGSWSVVSCPAKAVPGEPIKVIVERK